MNRIRRIINQNQKFFSPKRSCRKSYKSYKSCQKNLLCASAPLREKFTSQFITGVTDHAPRTADLHPVIAPRNPARFFCPGPGRQGHGNDLQGFSPYCPELEGDPCQDRHAHALCKSRDRLCLPLLTPQLPCSGRHSPQLIHGLVHDRQGGIPWRQREVCHAPACAPQQRPYQRTVRGNLHHVFRNMRCFKHLYLANAIIFSTSAGPRSPYSPSFAPRLARRSETCLPATAASML
jgi:hypothetical protein